MIYFKEYICKIGNLYITADEKGILSVGFSAPKNIKEERTNSIILDCIKQLDMYFLGKLKNFDLPLNPIGTEFQKKVWKELLNIPYGETRTYKEIATAIGNANASRAVGNANNKNPIGIIIPCHRVIGSNRKLIGYAGGLDKKEKLLNLERNFCNL